MWDGEKIVTWNGLRFFRYPDSPAPANRLYYDQRRRSGFIARSGRPLTVPFRGAFTFITRTGTRSTTIFPILRWWTGLPIWRPTHGLPSGVRLLDATCSPTFSPSLASGTAPPPARLTTPSSARPSGPIGSSIRTLVNSAARTLRRTFATRDSVYRSARRHGDAPQGSITSSAFVAPVETSSRATDTAANAAVHVRVALNRAAGTAPVYNLTVDRCPEYFANGVLVHNCRYALMHRPWYPEALEPDRPLGWVPGTAPSQDWFRVAGRGSAPMGSMS